MFALTWPQFQACGELLDRISWRNALNEVFFGVVSALGEKSDRENLFRSAGNFLKQSSSYVGRIRWTELDYTNEQLEAARKRAREINDRNKDLNQNA